MISVKDAAARAVAYLGDVYGSELANVMLEEVERDDKYWYVTLGYDRPLSDNPNPLGLELPLALKLPRWGRALKVFKIDASTGEVLSMKIREVASVE